MSIIFHRNLKISPLHSEHTFVGFLASENLGWTWNTDVGHMNSYVGIPMSNIGIQTLVCSILPQFLPNLMIL